MYKERSKAGQTSEARPVCERRRRINSRSVTCLAPFSKRIEILQRKSQRIHPLMATRAGRIVPMKFHTLPDGSGLAVRATFFQRGHIRRRRWNGRSEHVIEQPLAS